MNFRKKVLSFIDHTPEWLADNTERQAYRRGDARYDKRSDCGVWDICGEYAGPDEWVSGVK